MSGVGRGADITLDNVGGATFEISVKATCAFGHISLIAGGNIAAVAGDLSSTCVVFLFVCRVLCCVFEVV